jgi:hypothetical protein
MEPLKQNLPHLLMATVLIAAASTLAAVGVIPGTDAVLVITAAGGLSLGAGAVSTGANAPTTATTGSAEPVVTTPPSVPTATTTPPAA